MTAEVSAIPGLPQEMSTHIGGRRHWPRDDASSGEREFPVPAARLALLGRLYLVNIHFLPCYNSQIFQCRPFNKYIEGAMQG